MQTLIYQPLVADKHNHFRHFTLYPPVSLKTALQNIHCLNPQCIRTIINTSHVEITTFLLVGISGLEYAHICISIPICITYVVSLLGNFTILFVIKTEPFLLEPMYCFLSMLALSHLGLSLSSLPTMLRVFLFNAPGTSANKCFAQELFIHGFTVLESSVLLIISFDSFLAIHNPLRYSSILTIVRAGQIGMMFLFKSFLLVLPFPFTLRSLKYCQKSQLSYPCCLYQDVMKLACSDNKIDAIYGFFGALSLMVHFMLIVVSHILILKTVLGIASQKEQLKAVNTCVSHICAGIIFYLPIISLATVHCFGRHVSPLFSVLMANVLLLLPPLMNPVVYCVKTREIRVRIIAKLCQK
ncbi:LOW QUALITY PROTEIN: olfactory receptor 51A4-like [Pteronotus mesoamericanus]|uniref:LOW QUALITY PROTEIN: olfactory receptor 51A4-like n=1 Tax=Pteronotus mesoamericanus TaxID=1884717 RepID=UPI0023EAC437|nr:LOW QUALITY PROTEIN: olfactory receptor 51A4-like [Pteronotus parnellii mesoamericanus]